LLTARPPAFHLHQDDLKKMEISVSDARAAASAFIDEAPAGSIETSSAHGQRQWDIQVVPAAKAEASQVIPPDGSSESVPPKRKTSERRAIVGR